VDCVFTRGRTTPSGNFKRCHLSLKREAAAAVQVALNDPAVISTAVEVLVVELPSCELRLILHRLELRARDRRSALMHGDGLGV
jgi:hypothetical protein